MAAAAGACSRTGLMLPPSQDQPLEGRNARSRDNLKKKKQ